MLFVLALLLACTRLLLPGKGMVPAQGKGTVLAMVALLLFSTVPAEGKNYFAWWRVRHWENTFFFVFPDGWWQELTPEWVEALHSMANSEPEMMAYIYGQHGDPGPWPPVWHIPTQLWVNARTEPDRRLVFIAEPEDMDSYSYPLTEEDYGADTMDEAPGYNRPGVHSSPASASDGSGTHVMTDGTTIHAWSGRQQQPPPAQSSQPAQGYYAQCSQPAQGSCSQSSQPGQGYYAQQSSTAASSSDWWDGGWSCGWQQGWDWYNNRPEQGQWRTKQRGRSPAPPPGPPNPNRYFERGRGSQMKREERRKYERAGMRVPDHLKPQAQSLNKAAKQQMYLLHQQARKMAAAQSQEELDQLAEELQKLQAEEARRLQSLRKAKEDKEEKKEEQDTVPARRPYIGKHRTPSSERGTPAHPKKESLVPEEGNEEEEEEWDQNEMSVDWSGSGSEKSAGKRRSKTRRGSKRSKKKLEPVPEEGKTKEEEPPGPDKGPDKGPDPGPDPGAGAAPVATGA